MQDLAREVVAIAQAGLEARGLGEAPFLDVLAESAASGRVRADELLDRYHGDWAGDLDRIYPETTY